jgi:hypothetical protein
MPTLYAGAAAPAASLEQFTDSLYSSSVTTLGALLGLGDGEAVLDGVVDGVAVGEDEGVGDRVGVAVGVAPGDGVADGDAGGAGGASALGCG